MNRVVTPTMKAEHQTDIHQGHVQISPHGDLPDLRTKKRRRAATGGQTSAVTKRVKRWEASAIKRNTKRGVTRWRSGSA